MKLLERPHNLYLIEDQLEAGKTTDVQRVQALKRLQIQFLNGWAGAL